jgi:hypothetical protein
MHLSGSLEYQFAIVSSREKMNDFMSVALSAPTEAMVAS